MCLTVPFPLLPSRNGNDLVESTRIDGTMTEHIISTADLPEGEYSVKIAVVLGNEDTTETGEGNAMRASSNISIAGEWLRSEGFLASLSIHNISNDCLGKFVTELLCAHFMCVCVCVFVCVSL